MKIMLIVAALLLADCALGAYLDWKMRSAPSAPKAALADVYLVRSCGVSTGEMRYHADGRTEMVMRSVPCDEPNTLIFGDTPSQERRVYLTFTDAQTSGFFRNQRRWWRFVWNGHATWIVAPTWRSAASGPWSDPK